MSDNVVRVSSTVNDLIGIGTEYLVVDGTVIAKFYNGNMVSDIVVVSPGGEVTLTAA